MTPTAEQLLLNNSTMSLSCRNPSKSVATINITETAVTAGLGVDGG
jgi:hypothetical protein